MAVVECQGVSAAQPQLNMSQSAISTHLSHLETLLGLTLCKRGRGGFALTESGRQLYQACLVFASATDVFNEQLAAIKMNQSVLSGNIRLLMVDNLTDAFKQALYQLIAEVYEQHPQVSLSVDIRSPQSIETALTTQQADIGIGYFARPIKQLTYAPIFTERQTLYCSNQHPLYHDKKPTLQHIEDDHAWVMRGYLMASELSTLNPKVINATAYHMEATRVFILAGTHVGYLPENYAAPYVEKGLLKPLLPKKTSYDVQHYLVSRNEHGTIASWFADKLLSCFTADD